MKPIDVYVHVKFLAEHYKYPRNYFELFIQCAIHPRNGTPSLQQMEDMFEKRPPSTTALVQALDQLGIAPNKIAAWMGITKQSVSYHRKRPAEPYRNPDFEKYFEERVERDYNHILLTPKKRKKRKDSKVMIEQRRRELDELVNRNQN